LATPATIARQFATGNGLPKNLSGVTTCSRSACHTGSRYAPLRLTLENVALRRLDDNFERQHARFFSMVKPWQASSRFWKTPYPHPQLLGRRHSSGPPQQDIAGRWLDQGCWPVAGWWIVPQPDEPTGAARKVAPLHPQMSWGVSAGHRPDPPAEYDRGILQLDRPGREAPDCFVKRAIAADAPGGPSLLADMSDVMVHSNKR